MKRLLLLLLAVAMTLSLSVALTSCGTGDNNPDGNENLFEVEEFSFDSSGLTLTMNSETSELVYKVWIDAKTGSGVTYSRATSTIDDSDEDGDFTDEIGEMPSADGFTGDGWSNVVITGDKFYFIVTATLNDMSLDGSPRYITVHYINAVSTDGERILCTIQFTEKDAERPLAATFVKK